MKKIFDDFAKSYGELSDGMLLKQRHSKRVADISVNLAKSLNWDSDEILLAEQIGLLHDVGRFKELELFGNYSDKTFDHAQASVEMLKEDDFRNLFGVKKEDENILYNAIYYHNKKEVPEKLNDQYSMLIRDADKIDILYIYSVRGIKTRYTDSDTTAVSEKVLEDFHNKKPVSNKDTASHADWVLLILAFIFDINYDCTLKYIKDQKYLEDLYNIIKDKERYKEYFDEVNDYIEKRTKNVGQKIHSQGI